MFKKISEFEYNYLRKLLIFFLVLFFHFISFSQTMVSRINDLTLNGSKLNIGDCTPVVTFNDNLYAVWIEDRTLKVFKKSPNGTIYVKNIRSNIQDNIHHVMPSIALDSKGFIHITADMHNQDWVYYISDSKESITSFTQYRPGTSRCPPGNLITYPEFFKNSYGELYIAFRHRVKDLSLGNVPGVMAGGVAKYNVDKRTWTMLGGTAHQGYKTLVWANGGTNNNNGLGGWYQKPLVRLFWDKTNRMHLSSTLAVQSASNRTYNGMTHLLYAYSDDDGYTWHKADGTPINSLPLTPNNASVIISRPNQKDLISGSRVVAYNKNEPWVSYQTGEGENARNHIKRWYNGSWVEVNAPYKSNNLYARRNGEIVVFRPFSGLYVSKNNGQNWKHLVSDSDRYNGRSDQLDYQQYLLTGDFRWRTVERSSNEVEIYTYDRNEENIPNLVRDSLITGDVFYIKSKVLDTYIRPQNNNLDSPIVLAEKDNSDWFKWERVARSDGYYHLKNIKTGMYFRPSRNDDGVDPDVNNDGIGALMLQKPTNWKGAWTQWKEVISDDGSSYHLQNKELQNFLRPVTVNSISQLEIVPNTFRGNYTRWIFEAAEGGNSSGSCEVTVRAAGSTGEEVIQLLIDDEFAFEWAITSTSLANYKATVPNGGNVKIRFMNDGNTSSGADKNLRVDKLTFGGVTIEAENVTRQGCGNNEWLWCGGYFDFGNLSCQNRSSISDNKDNLSEVFKTYPNPMTSDILTVIGPDLFRITVYDIQGGVVMDADQISGQQTIDTQRLSNGLYIVKMYDYNSKSTKTHKIIVNK